jgi:tetratricopeptide (TPR) repeat protein
MRRAQWFGVSLLAAIALAAEPASAELTSAEAYFELAEFEVALSVLDDMLDTRDAAVELLDPGEWHRVHALRGRCLALLHRPDEAVDAFCRALQLDPAWVPDPMAFSSPELTVFRRADAQCERGLPPGEDAALGIDAMSASPWYRKRTTIGVAAAIVATAVVVWATGDDGGTSGEAPYFPDPPEGP